MDGGIFWPQLNIQNLTRVVAEKNVDISRMMRGEYGKFQMDHFDELFPHEHLH